MPSIKKKSTTKALIMMNAQIAQRASLISCRNSVTGLSGCIIILKLHNAPLRGK